MSEINLWEIAVSVSQLIVTVLEPLSPFESPVYVAAAPEWEPGCLQVVRCVLVLGSPGLGDGFVCG